jgi:hypothetical protein
MQEMLDALECRLALETGDSCVALVENLLEFLNAGHGSPPKG